MATEFLRPDEEQLIKRCLVAAADGPFFPDSEFHTIMGCDRSEMAEIASVYPDVSEADETAVNNAMLWLGSFPHGKGELLISEYKLTIPEIARVYRKWRGDNPKNILEAMR